MTQMRVLYDLVSWETKADGGGVDHHRARYGEEVDVSQEQADRWSSMTPPAAVPVGDASAEGLDAARGLLADEALGDLSVAETLAYVNQHPDEARRVFAAERGGRADESVLAATGLSLDDETDDGDPAVFPRPGVEYVSNPQQAGGGDDDKPRRRASRPKAD